jgi:hypothetical protein
MRGIAAFVLFAELAIAQTRQPFQNQSPSSMVYGVNKDGQQTIEILNVAYEVTDRLLLKTTTRTKQVVDEIGMEASTIVEAWPLGVDPKQKPRYLLKAAGVDAKTVDGALLVILRGLEDTEWWSVYKLGTGERPFDKLFDTYVPLLKFSIRRDIQTMRYVGLGESSEPNVVVVLTYASAEKVLRQAQITSDDPKQAQALKSFADASRAVSVVETPALALRISISQNYPSAPATVELTVPIVHDDFDLAHAQMPAHLHLVMLKPSGLKR